MAHYTDHSTDRDLRERDAVDEQRPIVTTTADPLYQPDYVTTVPVAERPSRVPAFLAGFVAAVILAAVAFATFLVVSDSDDDGNVDVDVPAVQVDDNGGG